MDINKRAAQKQQARDKDQERLDRGEITPKELQEENNFFKGIDLGKFKIVSIGGRPIR